MAGRRVWGAWILFVIAVVTRGQWRYLDTPPPSPAPIRHSHTPDRFRVAPLVFLSTAPADSLRRLPGIGPVLAARIVDARSGQRPYSSWDDLRQRVDGIGPKSVARLRQRSEPLDRPVGYWVTRCGAGKEPTGKN